MSSSIFLCYEIERLRTHDYDVNLNAEFRNIGTCRTLNESLGLILRYILPEEGEKLENLNSYRHGLINYVIQETSIGSGVISQRWIIAIAPDKIRINRGCQENGNISITGLLNGCSGRGSCAMTPSCAELKAELTELYATELTQLYTLIN